MIQIVELAIAVAALIAIGVGCWMYAPWSALVVVGGLVLFLTVIGKMRRLPQ